MATGKPITIDATIYIVSVKGKDTYFRTEAAAQKAAAGGDVRRIGASEDARVDAKMFGYDVAALIDAAANGYADDAPAKAEAKPAKKG